MIVNNAIKFKSLEENYTKEHSGRKSNTLRKVDPNDERFIKLKRMGVTEDYGKVQIVLASDDEESTFFIRQITDVCFYDGHCIISWSPLEDDENGGKF